MQRGLGQALDRGLAGNPTEHQRAQDRHRIGGGAVEMPGDLAGGVEARDRPVVAPFNNSGTFAYHCEVHGCPMKGTITVN